MADRLTYGIKRDETSVPHGGSSAVSHETREEWLTRHVDMGHGIVKREHHDECSCGDWWVRTTARVEGHGQDPAQDGARLHAAFVALQDRHSGVVSQSGHTHDPRAASKLAGANAAERASYNDGPIWPPTPPDDGRSPQDGPFTGAMLTVRASGEDSPARGLFRSGLLVEQADALAAYLRAHERDIKEDINDFGDLRPLLGWLYATGARA